MRVKKIYFVAELTQKLLKTVEMCDKISVAEYQHFVPHEKETYFQEGEGKQMTTLLNILEWLKDFLYEFGEIVQKFFDSLP